MLYTLIVKQSLKSSCHTDSTVLGIFIHFSIKRTLWTPPSLLLLGGGSTVMLSEIEVMGRSKLHPLGPTLTTVLLLQERS